MIRKKNYIQNRIDKGLNKRDFSYIKCAVNRIKIKNIGFAHFTNFYLRHGFVVVSDDWGINCNLRSCEKDFLDDSSTDHKDKSGQ